MSVVRARRVVGAAAMVPALSACGSHLDPDDVVGDDGAGGAAPVNARSLAAGYEKAAGWKATYVQGIDVAEFNFAPYVQQMKEKGVRAVDQAGSVAEGACVCSPNDLFENTKNAVIQLYRSWLQQVSPGGYMCDKVVDTGIGS